VAAPGPAYEIRRFCAETVHKRMPLASPRCKLTSAGKQRASAGARVTGWIHPM